MEPHEFNVEFTHLLYENKHEIAWNKNKNKTSIKINYVVAVARIFVKR
jgi:hypothetical protein